MPKTLWKTGCESWSPHWAHQTRLYVRKKKQIKDVPFMASEILNRPCDLFPLPSPVLEPCLLESLKREAISQQLLQTHSQGVRIEPWQNAWRKWHDVSSTYSSTICRVNFFVIFVVAFVMVHMRFVVAFLRERWLVLSSLILPPMFPAGQCTRQSKTGKQPKYCARASESWCPLALLNEIEHQNPRSCDIPTPSAKLSPKQFCNGTFSNFCRSAEKSP